MRKCSTQVLKSHEYNFRKDEKKEDIEGTGTAKNIEEVCSLVKYAFGSNFLQRGLSSCK